MVEVLALVLAGGVLGAVFYGGLWWTVRKSLMSKQPALWLFGSLLLRTSVALAGFYFVGARRWERMLLCLLGFATARLVVTWSTRSRGETAGHPLKEARHAP